MNAIKKKALEYMLQLDRENGPTFLCLYIKREESEFELLDRGLYRLLATDELNDPFTIRVLTKKKFREGELHYGGNPEKRILYYLFETSFEDNQKSCKRKIDNGVTIEIKKTPNSDDNPYISFSSMNNTTNSTSFNAGSNEVTNIKNFKLHDFEIFESDDSFYLNMLYDPSRWSYPVVIITKEPVIVIADDKTVGTTIKGMIEGSIVVKETVRNIYKLFFLDDLVTSIPVFNSSNYPVRIEEKMTTDTKSITDNMKNSSLKNTLASVIAQRQRESNELKEEKKDEQ